MKEGFSVIKYQAKVGLSERIKKGGNHTYWGALVYDREDAVEWAEHIINTSDRYDCFIIDEIEVDFTDDPREAKIWGYKPFWINMWEESKYVKKWYAKDKDSLLTDFACDEISDDFAEGNWEWKNGSSDWEIFEAEDDK